MSRYKGASENAEKIEDDLKVEKRKLQREVRVPPSAWVSAFHASMNSLCCGHSHRKLNIVFYVTM